MYNIMKAQMYQSVRDNGTYYTFLGGITAFGLSLIGIAEEGIRFSELTGSKYMVNFTNSIITIMLALVFTVRICGSDMSDKTINNEMLTGIKRSKVYAGRIVISLFYVMICFVLFNVMPVMIMWAANGWGYTMPLKEAMMRLFLEIIPITRYVCLIACLNFITMNPLAVALIGFMVFMGESLLIMIAEEMSMSIKDCLLPLFSMSELSEIENYNMTLGYVDGEDVQVLGSGLPSGTIATIVIAGAIAAVLYLAAGYCIFRKKDMD